MILKCRECEKEFSSEYLENMEERMLKGKSTSDVLYVENVGWFHRTCGKDGDLELGKIMEEEIELPPVEEEVLPKRK